MGEGQEVAGRFLVACGDAAVVLEAVDEALDKIATLVFLPVVPPLNDSVFQRWNDRLRVALPQQVQKSVRIISPVGNDCSRLTPLACWWARMIVESSNRASRSGRRTA